MSLQSDVLLGVQTPQILLRPIDVASLVEAQEAIELADAYGICRGNQLDASQRLTLEVGLGSRANGTWAARTMADFEPRQNGKNDSLAARELHGLVNIGEKLIIHTAHEAKTAKESFERLVAVFEAWDDLRKKVKNIRYANGEQGIYMRSGGRILYMTRTGSAGRGFAEADLVVYDEAQHLQREHVAASGPTKLANPNSQSWYMGSGGLAHSENAWRLRKRALKGVPGLFGYVEHTAEKVSIADGRIVSVKPDIMDRWAWAEANAAYNYRISDENFLELLEEIGPEMFARECLNLWDAEAGVAVGSWEPATWSAVNGLDDAAIGPYFLGVDATPDRSKASIAVAGGGAIELIVDERGVRLPGDVERLGATVIGLADKWKAPIAVDPAGPAAFILPTLERAGVNVVKVTPQQMGQAVGVVDVAVTSGTIRFRKHPDLDAAVAGARTVSKGDVWVWARKDSSVDVSPLVAATLAWWASSQAVALVPEVRFTNLADLLDEDDWDD